MFRQLMATMLVATIVFTLPGAAQARGLEGHSGDDLGTIVIANRGSGTISLINVETDQVVDTIVLPGETPEPMYVNFALGKVFVGDRGGNQVVVYDAEDFSLLGTIPAGNGVFHQWAHPNGKQIWINNDIDKTATVIDTESLAVLATVSIPAGDDYKPHDVFVHPNKPLAYVTLLGAAPGKVVQFSTETFQVSGTADVGADPHLSLSKQQKQLLVPSQNGNTVFVLDPVTLEQITTIAVPAAHGAWTKKNGQTFYTTNIAGGGTDGIYAIDLKTNTVIGSASTPYSTPHNIVATQSKLYVTHSGAAADKVSIYSISERNPVPSLIGEATVGLNPFGLGYVP